MSEIFVQQIFQNQLPRASVKLHFAQATMTNDERFLTSQGNLAIEPLVKEYFDISMDSDHSPKRPCPPE
jgi:hypothetical protein